MKFPRAIYAIQHNATKRIYIGSSSDVELRYWGHMYSLRSGKHPVEDMQQDFIDYGEDYSVFILDEINEWEERTKERDWMLKYKTNIRGMGYNYKDRYFRNGAVRPEPPYKDGLPDVPEKSN